MWSDVVRDGRIETSCSLRTHVHLVKGDAGHARPSLGCVRVVVEVLVR